MPKTEIISFTKNKAKFAQHLEVANWHCISFVMFRRFAFEKRSVRIKSNLFCYIIVKHVIKRPTIISILNDNIFKFFFIFGKNRNVKSDKWDEIVGEELLAKHLIISYH